MNNLVGIVLKKAVYEISKEIQYRQGLVDGIASGSVEGYADDNCQYGSGVVAGLKIALDILKSIGQGTGKTAKPNRVDELAKRIADLKKYGCKECKYYSNGSGEYPCWDCNALDEINVKCFFEKK